MADRTFHASVKLFNAMAVWLGRNSWMDAQHE
jgi:hypothetical protein